MFYSLSRKSDILFHFNSTPKIPLTIRTWRYWRSDIHHRNIYICMGSDLSFGDNVRAPLHHLSELFNNSWMTDYWLITKKITHKIVQLDSEFEKVGVATCYLSFRFCFFFLITRGDSNSTRFFFRLHMSTDR